MLSVFVKLLLRAKFPGLEVDPRPPSPQAARDQPRTQEFRRSEYVPLPLIFPSPRYRMRLARVLQLSSSDAFSQPASLSPCPPSAPSPPGVHHALSFSAAAAAPPPPHRSSVVSVGVDVGRDGRLTEDGTNRTAGGTRKSVHNERTPS